jgi:SMI1-KNR4 cell-wall
VFDAWVARLDEEFSTFPILVSGPASQQSVEKIAAYAGFNLPNSYQFFVRRYGAASVGAYPIFGEGAAHVMGPAEASVCEVTDRFRTQGWPHTSENLVISTDHAGNPIILNKVGQVFRFDHDSGETDMLANSFEAFILNLIEHGCL